MVHELRGKNRIEVDHTLGLGMAAAFEIET
jgi:hypothetical protein